MIAIKVNIHYVLFGGIIILHVILFGCEKELDLEPARYAIKVGCGRMD